MALIKIDWNPGEKKIRQFGFMLAGFSVLLASWWLWKGHSQRAWILGPLGLIAGLASAALPGTLGAGVYKAWMCVAFAIGSVVSPLLLGLLFYGILTPMGLVMRLIGRDALRLKRPATDSYWTPLTIPDDKSYFERLF